MPPQLRPVPDRPERAILYLRQSIAKDDSVSLELQETAGRDYAARMGYDVVDVVSDPGRSGRTLNRRQVQATIARIENREADIIIVWRWSRLSRSSRDFAVVCAEVADHGGRVESATEPIDVRNAAGRFARGVMAEAAAWESELRSEVWKEVGAKRRRDGVPAAGGQRFGYVHEKGSGIYEIDPVTGPILAEMYRRHIDGHGFLAIARWLNEQGITTRLGKPWARELVTRLLDAGFGAGRVVHGFRKHRTTTWHKGNHPAVITEAEWEAYQRLRNTRPSNYGRERLYYLSGLLKCGDCGTSMHSAKLGREAGYGYQCSRWNSSRLCRCITVARHRAEAAVEAWLSGMAAETDEAGHRHAMAVEERGAGRSAAEDISRRLTRADERLHRLTMGWTEGLVPDAAYRTSRDEIEALRARLQADLAETERRMQTIPDRPQVPDGLLSMWPDMNVVQRHEILRHLVARVEVHRPDDYRRGDGATGVARRSRLPTWFVIVATWGERFEEDSPGRWVPVS